MAEGLADQDFSVLLYRLVTAVLGKRAPRLKPRRAPRAPGGGTRHSRLERKRRFSPSHLACYYDVVELRFVHHVRGPYCRRIALMNAVQGAVAH